MAAAPGSQPTFIPPSTPIPVPVQIPAESSIWDRISSWVSENKAVVYTIAGVTVAVAAGGVIYYSSNSVRTTHLRPHIPSNNGPFYCAFTSMAARLPTLSQS